MKVIHFDTIDSTNEAAKRMIKSGEITEPAYLLAREQTAGRGSRGRKWASPRDAGIYLTVVEPMAIEQFPSSHPEPRASALADSQCEQPDTNRQTQPTETEHTPTPATSSTALTLAAGVACAEALSEAAGIDVRLKPINDLYYQGGKIGGILIETTIVGGVIEAVITGVGVNIRKADRPVTPLATAPISLEEAVGAERFSRIDLDRLVATLVAQIRKWQADVYRGNIEAVRKAWESRKLPGTKLPTV